MIGSVLPGTGTMNSVDVSTAYLSRVGGRRRNEDACGYWLSEGGCCWVVSDGAGGHGGGDVASRMVVQTILDRFAAYPVVSTESVIGLIEVAHDTVMNAKESQPAGVDMHATCVVLLIDRVTGGAVWAHAGDSRVYLFRAGELVFQTRDHSLIQSMIDAGYGSPDLVRTHPQRSLLTSAIGNAGELVVSVSGDPVQMGEGDVFMLCSDGWWEYVDESGMQQTLAQAQDMEHWLQTMAEVIGKQAPEGNDNYTAVGIRLVAGGVGAGTTDGAGRSARAFIFPTQDEAA